MESNLHPVPVHLAAHEQFRGLNTEGHSSQSFFNRSLPLVFLFSALLTFTSHGQGVKVTAVPDTDQIRIGEQFNIKLSAVLSQGASVSFPVIPDSLQGLEIIRRSGIDTLKNAPGQPLTLQQQLVVTGFDSGYYVIEPFHFTVRSATGNTDTLSTEAQLIHVKTISIDTTKAIKDIKPVMEPPFDWRELLPFLVAILIVIVLAIVGWLIYRKYKNKPVVPVQIGRAHV